MVISTIMGEQDGTVEIRNRVWRLCAFSASAAIRPARHSQSNYPEICCVFEILIMLKKSTSKIS